MSKEINTMMFDLLAYAQAVKLQIKDWIWLS